MTRTSLSERIKEDLFVLDGAMGTELIARGVKAGVCNDYLNIESPELIGRIHSAYFEAGSDAVITNTFGANQYALGRYGYSEQAERINTAGAEIARLAAGDDKYILGDIGPSGDFLEPLGTLKARELKAAFARQAEALAAGGVDGFIVETMTAIEEALCAIEAIKSVSDLPVFVSIAFEASGEKFKTMMGVDVNTVVQRIIPLGVPVIGFNCGTASMDDYVKLAREYISVLSSAHNDTAVLAEPNAGKANLVDGKAVYNLSVEDFCGAMEKIHSMGVKIVGGCCGTTPAHIKAMVKIVKR